MKKGLFLGALIVSAAGANAQVLFNGSYSQNFDTLASTGTGNAWTNNTTLAGWYASRVVYNAGTGSSNTGAMYSFGNATTPADRSLGSVASGSVRPVIYGVRLRNNTGGTLSRVDINYIGEQFRDGGATAPNAHTLFFSYSLVATNIGTDTQSTSGIGGYVADTNYTAFSGLDFTSPTFTNTGAGTFLDGNLAANRTAKSGSINLNWTAGSDLWLRWVDIDNSGNDHGLSVDDLNITAVPEPTTIAALGLGAAALIRRRKKS